MIIMISSAKHILFPTLLLFALTFILVLGCDNNTKGPVKLDFEKTLPDNGHQDSKESGPALRAAAGAMVSPKETYTIYRDLFRYVSESLNRELVFVQRKTYAEINDLIRNHELDIAFICSGPYALGRDDGDFVLLATPQVDGGHQYRSYLIVNKDSPFQSLADLQGRTFAFTDPDSNTGRLVPLFWLDEMGASPEEFFSRTIFTYSHDNSILAVARGLVDGAAVDSLIWDYYEAKGSEITARTRIIRRSEPFGIPPVVASADLDREFLGRVQSILLSMHEDPAGERVLSELLIDKFIKPEDSWYDPIRGINQRIKNGSNHADMASRP